MVSPYLRQLISAWFRYQAPCGQVLFITSWQRVWWGLHATRAATQHATRAATRERDVDVKVARVRANCVCGRMAGNGRDRVVERCRRPCESRTAVGTVSTTLWRHGWQHRKSISPVGHHYEASRFEVPPTTLATDLQRTAATVTAPLKPFHRNTIIVTYQRYINEYHRSGAYRPRPNQIQLCIDDLDS